MGHSRAGFDDRDGTGLVDRGLLYPCWTGQSIQRALQAKIELVAFGMKHIMATEKQRGLRLELWNWNCKLNM